MSYPESLVSTDPAPKHTRRPRYRGTHPRRFHERYKELAAAEYPELIAHVRESGRTPAGQHVAVLAGEVLEALALQPGMRGIDATLGFGGHAERILAAIAPGGMLLALDADPNELPRTHARLRQLGYDDAVLLVRRTNFAGVHAAVATAGWDEGVDFLLADLGVSSMQIDDPLRGFSFKADGPLDMRMNPGRGVPAAEWLQRVTRDALTAALVENADEPHASLIADALDRQRGSISTTRALADAVSAALHGRAAPEDVDLAVRRVFQAVRIAVNDEFGALDALLRQLPHCLRPGGRVALISFHSGEDRRVKKALEEGERAGIYTGVTRQPVRASPSEQRANPRAKPAKLRAATRT